MTTRMTRKDFEAIAAIMANNRPHSILEGSAHEYWRQIRDSLSSHFESTNPRFDKDKFEKACNVA